MKNVVTLLFIAFAFVSCEDHLGTGENKHDPYHRIVIIDGCEYILMDESQGNSGYGYMSHKGDCKNPIHCHNE